MDDGSGLERFNDRLRFIAIMKSIEWEKSIMNEMFLPSGMPRTDKRPERWHDENTYVHENQLKCGRCLIQNKTIWMIHDPVKGHHCPGCYVAPKPVDTEWNNGELNLFG